MGNWIVFGSTLREEMKPYAELSLSGVRKLSRRFESLQQSFGWGIDLATFAALFRLNSSDPAAQRLWQCWDTDGNGVTDVLEILSGLTLISQGKFEDKLTACFDLFDFDSSASLTLEELRICIRTSLSGLCKLLGQEEPAGEEVAALSSRAFAVVGGGGSSISRAQFLRWVCCTPTIIGTVCRFGTMNGEQTRSKYAQLMAEDKAALKIQHAFKGFRGGNTAATGAGNAAAGGSGGAASASAGGQRWASSAASAASAGVSTASARVDSVRHRSDPALASAFEPSSHATALRRAQNVFDSIDSDGSGSISTRELLANMSGGQHNASRDYQPATLSAFRAMDADGSGSITFDEFLRVLFPSARARDIRAMERWVRGAGAAVDREMVQALLLWFNRQARRTTGSTDFGNGAGASASGINNARGSLIGSGNGSSGSPGSGRGARVTVTLRDAIASLQSDDLFRPLVEFYVAPPRLLDTHLTFPQLMQELCGGQGPRAKERLARILQWAKEGSAAQPHLHSEPSRSDMIIDAKQQRELETLFNLYDQDEQGRIDMAELRSHFDGLGFSKQESSRLFHRYDSEGHRRVNLAEFKEFYRSVWEAQTAKLETPHAQPVD